MKDNAIARAVGKTLSQPEKTLKLTVNGQAQEVGTHGIVAPAQTRQHGPIITATRKIHTNPKR